MTFVTKEKKIKGQGNGKMEWNISFHDKLNVSSQPRNISRPETKQKYPVIP